MTLQWTFAAGFLYAEIGVLLLFCLPFISPKRWNKIFNSRVVSTLFEYGNFYFNVIVIVMALLLAAAPRPPWSWAAKTMEWLKAEFHSSAHVRAMSR